MMATLDAQGLADLWASLAAAAGLCLIHSALVRAKARGGEVGPFLLNVRVLLLLLLARSAFWAFGWSIAGAMALLAAAALPLSVLLLAEHTRRQHAPLALKLSALGIAVVGVPLALLDLGPTAHAARLVVFLLAQITAFAAIAWFVFRRLPIESSTNAAVPASLTKDEGTKTSAAPQKSTVWLATALLLSLPLLATDYRIGPWAELPVRMGGLAVLALCWLGATLPRAHAGRREAFLSLGLFATTAMCAAGAIATTAGLDAAGWVRSSVLALSIGMVAAIAIELRRARLDVDRQGLADGLTDLDLSDLGSYFDALEQRATRLGGRLWRAEDLRALDHGVLLQAFSTDRLQTPAAHHDTDQAVAEHLAFLRERAGSSHLLLLCTQPMAILALPLPDPLSAPTLERDMRAALRLAQLLARQHPPASLCDSGPVPPPHASASASASVSSSAGPAFPFPKGTV